MVSRFVSPDRTTLPLSNGDTIVVRRRLNTGEQRAGYKRARGAPIAAVAAEITDLAHRLTDGVDLASARAAILEAVARLSTASGPIDPIELGLATITSYLLDWSLTDESGAPVPIRGESVETIAAAVNNLDPESYVEIKTAIEAHEAAMAAARAQ